MLPRATESPVSIVDEPRDTEEFPAMDSDAAREVKHKMENSEVVTRSEPRRLIWSKFWSRTRTLKTQSRSSIKKRFTFAPGFFREVGKGEGEKEKITTLKKQRRRTLSFTKSGDDTPPIDDKFISGSEYENNSSKPTSELANKEEFAT